MRIITYALYFVLILVGVTFALLNAETVMVHFYVRSFKLPVSLLLVLTLACGVIFGYTICLLKYWRLKCQYRHVKNKLQLMEREIKNLRTIPLQN